MGVDVGIKITENVRPYEPTKKGHVKTTISAEYLWEIMTTIAEDYDLDDLELAFGTEFIADAIPMYSLDAFVEAFEKYEPERKRIHVGDEVEWGTAYSTIEVSPGVWTKGDQRQTGVVVSIDSPFYKVLTTSGRGDSFYVIRIHFDDRNVRKTGNRFGDLIMGADDRKETEVKK